MNKPISVPASVGHKMKEEGLNSAAVRAFEDNYLRMVSGGDGMIPESTLSPVTGLPQLDKVSPKSELSTDLAGQLVVIKLNGGLGTGMGLDKAKSLLEVKDGLTFLDLIARQVLVLRKTLHPDLRFLLMNSFSTREDTLAFLNKYEELASGQELDFLQSKVPKIDIKTMEPVQWPQDASMEWCPPGHGDIYLSLMTSGVLEELLAQGIRYAFISNSDNLGAFPDLRILEYMRSEAAPFLMEVTRRTEADKKGGHLALRQSDGRLILRESAQCPEEDKTSFQDIQKYSYFNTNNLWIRLDRLKAAMDENGGFLSLPLIMNRKTVDPRATDSPEVWQLETAMGSAIEMFEGAKAIEVPRSRFAPVKKTDDLLALRSDAYEITNDYQVRLIKERNAIPPSISLDSKYYKLISDFDRYVAVAPSLKHCKTLDVQGPIQFQPGLCINGEVRLKNSSQEMVAIKNRTLSDEKLQLP